LKYTNSIKSIAIGSFDGIHIAHKALIDQVDALVIIERNGGYLTPGYKRANFTTKVCCFYHFDVIKGLTPEAFVEKLKQDFPALESIVVGYDFAFGKNKAGNAQILRDLCDKEVIVVEEVSIEGISVHSRTIKAYLAGGNIAMANTLLGRRYVIDGDIIKGQGIGKNELVATINLNVQGYQLPKEGVYATRTLVEGTWMNSVSFLGHRVSTDGNYAVETHILGEELGAITGTAQLEFVSFIRFNQKFESLEELKVQIKNDIFTAKKVLDESI
jgi:riboflavin kinase/FMN adenylyltransferase